MATFTVLYDACVLYPASLRDLLLQLAQTGLFHARWTIEIHDEWIENLLKNEPRHKRANLERTRQLMDESVLDCLIHNYEPLIAGLTLKDENDRHVLAAAIRGRADLIVTFNLTDFPRHYLKQFDIEPIHPDEFVCNLLTIDAEHVYASVRKVRERLRNPKRSPQEILDKLKSLRLTKTVAHLYKVLDQI